MFNEIGQLALKLETENSDRLNVRLELRGYGILIRGRAFANGIHHGQEGVVDYAEVERAGAAPLKHRIASVIAALERVLTSDNGH